MKNIRVQDIPAPKSPEGVVAAIELCNLKLGPMRDGLRVKMEAGEDCGGVNRAIAVWESQLAVYEKMRVIYESPGSREAFDTIERLKQSLKGAEGALVRVKKSNQDFLCEIREALESTPRESFPPNLITILTTVQHMTRDTYDSWKEFWIRKDRKRGGFSDLMPEVELEP